MNQRKVIRLIYGFEKDPGTKLMLKYPLKGISLEFLKSVFPEWYESPEDPEMALVYPINHKQAQALQPYVVQTIDTEKYDFQLHCYEHPDTKKVRFLKGYDQERRILLLQIQFKKKTNVKRLHEAIGSDIEASEDPMMRHRYWISPSAVLRLQRYLTATIKPTELNQYQFVLDYDTFYPEEGDE